MTDIGRERECIATSSKEDLVDYTQGFGDSLSFIRDFCYPHFKETRESEGQSHS